MNESGFEISFSSSPITRRSLIIGMTSSLVIPTILGGCSTVDIRNAGDKISSYAIAALTAFRELMGYKTGGTEVAAADFVNPTQQSSNGLIETQFWYSGVRAREHLARLQGPYAENYFETAFEPLQPRTDRVNLAPNQMGTLTARKGASTRLGTYAIQYRTAVQTYNPTNSQIYLIEI